MTIQDINSFIASTGKSSVQLHEIVNNFATTPVIDPTGFSPVADAAGSNYLATLVEAESVLAGDGRYIADKGDTIGLTNDSTFNQRIARYIAAV